MEFLKIGEVAEQIGVETSTIRYYESIGLLPAPSRLSGQRRYDPAVLTRLNVIRAAREIGFTLDEIRLLLDGFPVDTPPSERWQALAESKLPSIDAMLNNLLNMKRMLQAGLACECDAIETCFGGYTQQKADR